MERLSTARLELSPCPRERLAEACAQARRGDLGEDWPDFEAIPLFEAHAAAALADPTLEPWGPWTVHDESGELVGDVGFKGPPGEDGTVELSYFVRREHRGRGIATEALGALVPWAVAHGARRVVAEVRRDNLPSIAVVRALGFTVADSLGELLLFERSFNFPKPPR